MNFGSGEMDFFIKREGGQLEPIEVEVAELEIACEEERNENVYLPKSYESTLTFQESAIKDIERLIEASRPATPEEKAERIALNRENTRKFIEQKRR